MLELSRLLLSTLGLTDIELSFDFIANGEGLNDNASVVYNTGAGWQVLVSSLKSPVCNNGSGQWEAYSMILPAALENQPNLQLGFNWTNNADNMGTDPSVAINNLRVVVLENASFTYAASTYEIDDTDPVPTITGVAGGTFTSTNGLSINSSTGEIDLSASVTGTYIITYTTTGSTGNAINSSTQTITINSRDNDNLANATPLTFGGTCTGDIYSTASTSLETGEDVNNCSIPSASVTGSQWFSFVAPASGNAIIKFDQDTPEGMIMALYTAPSNLSDLNTLGDPIDCSRESRVIFDQSITLGAFIDAKDLVSGGTYYVQVYSELSTDTAFCLSVEEPTIYTFNNGWIAPNGSPEGISEPYSRVEILNGIAVLNNTPATGGSGNIWGSTYVSNGATFELEYLIKYGSLVVDGIFNCNLSEDSILVILRKNTAPLNGNGTLNVNFLAFLQFPREFDITSDLNINIFERLASTSSINSLKTITFKSTSQRTAYYSTETMPNYSLTGNIISEQYFPETGSTTGRAFRFVGSPVSSTATIFDNWQEGGAASAGFGTDITGTAGNAGGFDPATGFDLTGQGNPSMFTYSNDTGQTWDVVTSTNQVGDLLNPGNAYRLYIRGDRTLDLDVVGSSNSTTLRSRGSLSHADLTKSYDVEPGQFVLIANPYQNALDMETLIDDSSNITDDVIYYWDPTLGGANGQGAYVTYTGFDNGGTGMALPSSSANNGFLQPGQAAFIVANAGSAGAGNDMVVNYRSSQLNENGLITGAATTVTSVASSTAGSIQMELYDTYSLNNGHSSTDALLVRFSDRYDAGRDVHDHIKAWNIDESISIYKNNVDYVINSMPFPSAGDVVNLRHYNYGDTDYTYLINVNGINGVVPYLRDNFNGSLTQLNNGFTSFTFNVDANDPLSVANDRFELVFQTQTLSIDSGNLNNSFTIYPNPSNGGTVFLSANQLGGVAVELTVTDLLGKQISIKDTSFNAQGTLSFETDNIPTGIYLISVKNGDMKYTGKLIVE